MEKENKDKSAKWLIKFNNNISIVEVIHVDSNSFEEEFNLNLNQVFITCIHMYCTCSD